MQRQQQGFTLIELVIVIVILGVLSAFALPRFADLGGDARTASIEGVAGSIKSASSIVHSACLADSGCDDSATEISLEGEPIALDSTYPDATSGGIQLAAQIEGDDSDGGDFNVTTGTGTLTVASRGAPGICQIVYTNVSESDTNSPEIETDTSGCSN